LVNWVGKEAFFFEKKNQKTFASLASLYPGDTAARIIKSFLLLFFKKEGLSSLMPISVVTGATSGIGRWIALGLCKAGHVVVLPARDLTRAEATAAWIRSLVPAADIDLVAVDLSHLGDTGRAGASIAARHGAVDVLVNNAGVFCARRETTAEGIERVIAVNHLAPYVLTSALLPSLRKAASAAGAARIVNVGSSTSDRAGIDPTDLQGERRWGMVRAYGQSKLALMMATMVWSQRLHGTGVVANVVHPGAVATGLVRAKGPIGLAWRLMAPFLLTEAAGADTPLYVALSAEFGAVSGAYVKRRRAVAPNRLALDPALVAQVWAATETLAGRVSGAA
jgi:NAD(P)-dependent dehydrogenase (short-subunit alcohol dehydrogenase family)